MKLDEKKLKIFATASSSKVIANTLKHLATKKYFMQKYCFIKDSQFIMLCFSVNYNS